MSDDILELAEKTPVEELENIYNLEMARAKKAVWTWVVIDDRNEYRHNHIVFPGSEYPIPHDSPPFRILRRHKSTVKYPFRPNRPGNHGECTSADCPVKNKIHLTGLYFRNPHDRGIEPWPNTEWFGYSQAPPEVWDAVRRLEDEPNISKSTKDEDLKMVTGFRNCHYFGITVGKDHEEVVERKLAPWKAKIDAFWAQQPEELRAQRAQRAERAHFQASQVTELGKLVAEEANIRAYAKEPEEKAQIKWGW